MTPARLLTVASAVVLLSGCSSSPPSHPHSPVAASSSAVAGATRRIVVRPVTASGLLAPGFRTSHETDTVTCSAGQAASPVAVDNDIVACTPESSYAVACWPAADPGHVFCLRDPWADGVVELPVGGSIPHVTAPAHPQPLGLTLADGTHCTLRAGGTSTVLAAHPTWFASFLCNATTAVWGPANSDGVDMSAPTWTVQVASLDGSGALATTAVVAAYYAGTAA